MFLRGNLICNFLIQKQKLNQFYEDVILGDCKISRGSVYRKIESEYTRGKHLIFLAKNFEKAKIIYNFC